MISESRVLCNTLSAQRQFFEEQAAKEEQGSFGKESRSERLQCIRLNAIRAQPGDAGLGELVMASASISLAVARRCICALPESCFR